MSLRSRRRQVFKAAIFANASPVRVVHNRPATPNPAEKTEVVHSVLLPDKCLEVTDDGGDLFGSPRGSCYTPRQIQQLVKELAAEAGIIKRVYPHLFRHTIAQYLADRGMPENLLQKILGHESPRTTQIYYQPNRMNVKRAFEEAMRQDPFV